MSSAQEEKKYYEGLLDQKNGKWTSYWSVLKGKWLFFYKDRDLAQAVASVGINAHTQVIVGKTKAPNSYQFLVRGDAPQLRLRCSTTQERTRWMDEIVRCSKGELPSYASSQSHQPIPHPQQNQAVQRQPSQQQHQAVPRPPSQQQQNNPPAQRHGPTPASMPARSAVQARPLPGEPPSPSPLSMQQRSSLDDGRPSKHLRRKSSDLDMTSMPPPGQNPRVGGTAPPLPGEEAVDLPQYGWFFGTMNRDRSEDIIKSASVVGSFLIRQSGSSNNSFSLSFQDEDRIRHYLIAQQANGKYALAGLEDMSFRSLTELVKYYIEVNSGWAKPLNKADYGVGGGGPSSAAPRYHRPPAVRSDGTTSTPSPVPQPEQQQQRPENPGTGPMRPSPQAQVSGGGSIRPSPQTQVPGAGPMRPSPQAQVPRATSMRPSPQPQVPGPARRVSLPEGQSPSPTGACHPGVGARQSPQPLQGKPAPAPPASKRPHLLVRGASDMDSGRVRQAALQKQKQEEAARHMRSKSVKLQPTEPEVKPLVQQFSSLDMPHLSRYEDTRRQQLFPDSASQSNHASTSAAAAAFSAANPSVPARSAVSLGAKQSYQNVAAPRDQADDYDPEDYISTAEITSGTSYLNHEFRDSTDYRDDEMHDYLDLNDCASPSPPPSAMAPASMLGTRVGPQPPPPGNPPPSNLMPLRPPKPTGVPGGRNGDSGRHSPLYDHVS